MPQCGIIRGCATNRNYYYINVVCIQTVPYWGTNRGCGINRGNTVCGDKFVVINE